MSGIHAILKKYWGYDQFRPLQEEVIQSVLDGRDTLSLMPTGGGKSLCYQVPAMTGEGMCLVISPLIALMKDQVEGLRKKNITAYAIYSGMTRKEVLNVLKVVTESNCKFLYVSPERLETKLFREYLPGMGITLVAVDEAHCISQWGYDFRPHYLRIAALRKELPAVPVLALTASATPDVQEDICAKLNPLAATDSYSTGNKPLPGAMESWNIFRQSFSRPNLSYSVFEIDAKINKILEVLNNVAGTAIIYCRSRKRTKDISDLLQLHGITADHYHAGLSQEDRNRKQEDWLADKIRVIVCTNAFGMGIDKPGVRVVIHADVPDCLENYYQEAGRAGRDGKTAYAVLLFSQKELADLELLPAIRFPAEKDIVHTYQSVANYLQLHTGDGAGQYYDFDISDFVKKFKLDASTALYSLKALEQDGWLSFNEQVFLSSTVRFTIYKDRLYDFEREQPLYEPVIKALLRGWEGIFDQPVFMSEKMLAGLLRQDSKEVTSLLIELDKLGVIEYIPQKNSPQLFFPRPRIRTEELKINMIAFNQRKERFTARVMQMLAFVREKVACRSQVIGTYFGDKDITVCGTCDNCRRQKSFTLGKEEFDSIHHRILNLVKYESLAANELLQKLTGVKKEKAWKVLEFLQAEQKIEMDKQGKVRLK